MSPSFTFHFIRKMYKKLKKRSLEKYSLKDERIKELWIFQNVKHFTEIFCWKPSL